jgi:hypothetical protein
LAEPREKSSNALDRVRGMKHPLFGIVSSFETLRLCQNASKDELEKVDPCVEGIFMGRQG